LGLSYYTGGGREKKKKFKAESSKLKERKRINTECPGRAEFAEKKWQWGVQGTKERKGKNKGSEETQRARSYAERRRYE
jgi:hypothetical protein